MWNKNTRYSGDQGKEPLVDCLKNKIGNWSDPLLSLGLEAMMGF